MSLEKYSDLELLSELINRNGSSLAPSRVSRLPEYMETLVAIGKDETASIVFHESAKSELEDAQS